MRKKVYALAIGSVFFGSTAFATIDITTAGTSIGGGSYKTSSGVTVKLTTNATGTQYGAGSANVKGKKEYGTSNADPKIYSKDAATPGTPTVTTDSPDFSSGWTAQ